MACACVPDREAYRRAAEIAALASHALPNCDFWEADMPEIASYVFYFIGAATVTRTPDPLITNEVLYQLSYCGLFVI